MKLFSSKKITVGDALRNFVSSKGYTVESVGKIDGYLNGLPSLDKIKVEVKESDIDVITFSHLRTSFSGAYIDNREFTIYTKVKGYKMRIERLIEYKESQKVINTIGKFVDTIEEDFKILSISCSNSSNFTVFVDDGDIRVIDNNVVYRCNDTYPSRICKVEKLPENI